MFCPACGHNLPLEAAFCMACGKQVPASEEVIPTPKASEPSPSVPRSTRYVAGLPAEPMPPVPPTLPSAGVAPVPDGKVCETHTTTWATMACIQCGRAFCDACRQELNAQLLCSDCSEMNRHKGAGVAAARAQMSLLLAICGIATCGLLDLLAFYMAGRALVELEHAPWATKERAQARAARIIAIVVITLGIVGAFIKVLSETVLRRT